MRIQADVLQQVLIELPEHFHVHAAASRLRIGLENPHHQAGAAGKAAQYRLAAWTGDKGNVADKRHGSFLLFGSLMPLWARRLQRQLACTAAAAWGLPPRNGAVD
jgi:hypothetical protein